MSIVVKHIADRGLGTDPTRGGCKRHVQQIPSLSKIMHVFVNSPEDTG